MGLRTVFVTGGAGFIGSNFVNYLLHSLPQVNVLVYDKLTYAGSTENLARVWNNPRFSFVQGDICDACAVRDAMRGSDVVVHFAAETHVDRSILNRDNRDVFMHTNMYGAYTLLEAAQALNIQRFLHVSTVEVYGSTEKTNTAGYQFLENDPHNPKSPYASSKSAADRLAFSYWTTFGLPVVITRCINNYGPYQYPEKQIPLFITNALQGRPLPVHGDGQNTRNWIHVEDHCSALLAILTARPEQVNGEVFNIGTDEERSVLDNAQAVLRLCQLSNDHIAYVPERRGAVRRLAVDSTKLRERLGWSPKISFEEGLEDTVKWYAEQEDWLKHIMDRGDEFLKQALHLGISELSSSHEPVLA